MALITRLATAFDNPNLNTLPPDPILPPNNTGAVRFYDPSNTLTNPDPSASSTLAVRAFKDMVTETAYNSQTIGYNSNYGAVLRYGAMEDVANGNRIWDAANQGHDFLFMAWVYNGKYPDPLGSWGFPQMFSKGTGDFNAPAQLNPTTFNAQDGNGNSNETWDLGWTNTDRYNVTGISSAGVVTIDSSTYGESPNGAIWRGMGIQYIYSDDFNITSSADTLWADLASQVNGTSGTAGFRKGIQCRVTHVPGDTFNGATLTSSQFVVETKSTAAGSTFATLTSANVATNGSAPYTSGYFTAEWDDRAQDPYDLITTTGTAPSVPIPHEKVSLVAYNWQKNTVQPNTAPNLTSYTQIWQSRARSRYEGGNDGWTPFFNMRAFGAGNKGISWFYHSTSDSSASNPTGTRLENNFTGRELPFNTTGTRPFYFWRLYIEDLTLSGRNAEDVYDLEWNLNSARIIQAASQIPKGDPSP